MIIGIGTDICDINRIEATLERFNKRFMMRVFTMQEIHYACQNTHKKTSRFSQFFAAKEACSKALGTGIQEGVFWKDIEVMHHPSGQPMITLHHGAKQKLHKLSHGAKTNIWLSLTDDAGFAQAFVVIDAL